MQNPKKIIELSIPQEVHDRIASHLKAGQSVEDYIANAVGHQFIDANEAGAILCLSPSTVYQKARAGELPFYQVTGKILFDRMELLDLIKKSRRGTKLELRQLAATHMAKAMK